MNDNTENVVVKIVMVNEPAVRLGTPIQSLMTNLTLSNPEEYAWFFGIDRELISALDMPKDKFDECVKKIAEKCEVDKEDVATALKDHWLFSKHDGYAMVNLMKLQALMLRHSFEINRDLLDRKEKINGN